MTSQLLTRKSTTGASASSGLVASLARSVTRAVCAPSAAGSSHAPGSGSWPGRRRRWRRVHSAGWTAPTGSTEF